MSRRTSPPSLALGPSPTSPRSRFGSPLPRSVSAARNGPAFRRKGGTGAGAETAIASHAALDLLSEHAEGCDAVSLAISFEPGLAAERELFRMPVVGMTEAAWLVASAFGSRVALISFPWAAMEQNADRGLRPRRAARGLGADRSLTDAGFCRPEQRLREGGARRAWSCRQRGGDRDPGRGRLFRPCASLHGRRGCSADRRHGGGGQARRGAGCARSLPPASGTARRAKAEPWPLLRPRCTSGQNPSRPIWSSVGYRSREWPTTTRSPRWRA